jgi:hypothetical protein
MSWENDQFSATMGAQLTSAPMTTNVIADYAETQFSEQRQRLSSPSNSQNSD